MPEVCESGIIDATADKAWSLLRDFGGLKNYADDIVSCEIEEGRPADQVGAIRHLVIQGGLEVRERLIALSDQERYLKYNLVPPETLPMRDYIARLRVVPITDEGKALVELSGTFSVAEGHNPEEVQELVRSVYKAGIKGMQNYIVNA